LPKYDVVVAGAQRTIATLILLAACARPKPAAPPVAAARPEAHGQAVLAAPVHKTGPASLYPDPDKTPGVTNPNVTQANIHQTICRRGWTRTIRPPITYTTPLKRQQMQEYGDTVPDRHKRCMPHSGNPHCYEEDHFISLELGGDPRAPKNLWPEPYKASPGAKEKDRVENYLHGQVCHGTITLEDPQRMIVTDWYAVYRANHPYRLSSAVRDSLDRWDQMYSRSGSGLRGREHDGQRLGGEAIGLRSEEQEQRHSVHPTQRQRCFT